MCVVSCDRECDRDHTRRAGAAGVPAQEMSSARVAEPDMTGRASGRGGDWRGPRIQQSRVPEAKGRGLRNRQERADWPTIWADDSAVRRSWGCVLL